MASTADLKILISVTNEAKGILSALLKDVASLSAQLNGISNIPGVSDEFFKGVVEGAEAAARESKLAEQGIVGVGRESLRTEISLGRLGAALKFVAGGFLALKSVQFVKNLADQAARTQTLGVVLEITARNAGITATEIQKADKAVQDLGITASSSRQSLTQFIQAGLDISKAGELARVAQDSAVIAGQNSSDTFQRLIINIQQLDTMGLRHMGIVISTDEAYEAYAKTIDKTANALTQTEKQQAVFNAVLAKGADIAGVYEASMNTVGKQLSSLPRHHEALAVSLGNLLLPAYSAIVVELTDFLKQAGKLSDNLDEQGEAGEALGEVVRDIAKSIKEFTLAVIELKDGLIILGGVWATGKIVAWAASLAGAGTAVGAFIPALRAFIVQMALVHTLSGTTATALTLLRGAFGALMAVVGTAVRLLGGWPVVLVQAAVALYLLVQRSERAKQAVVAFVGSVDLLINTALVPLKLQIIGLGAAWEFLTNLFKGKGFEESLKLAKEKASKELAEMEREFRAKGRVIADAANVAVNGSPTTVAGADTSKTDQVTAAIVAQIKVLDDLKKKFAEAKLAGDEAATEQLRKQIQKANVDQAELVTALEKIKKRKDLTEEEKKAIKVTEEALAADGKRRKEMNDFAKAVGEAQKILKTSEWKIDGKKVFSADSQAAIAAFKTLTKDALVDVQAGGDQAQTAMTRLRLAFEELTKTAKTQDDLAAIRDLLREIGVSGETAAEQAAAAAVAASLKGNPEQAAAERRIREEQQQKYKAALAERRAIQQSEFELSQARTQAGYDIELATIKANLSKQDELYRQGQVSIAAYYKAKRDEVQKTADFELAQLRAEEAQIGKQLNDRAGRDTAELNGLKQKQVEIQGQIKQKTIETKVEVDALVAAEREALLTNQRLLNSARAAYLEVIGQSAKARKEAIEQDLERQRKEVKPGEAGTAEAAAADETNKYLTETARIKKELINLDERSKVVRLQSAELSSREAATNRQFELGLLTRKEYEQSMRDILAQRVVIAERELVILREKAAIANTPEAQEQILQKEREILELRTRAMTQLRKTADDINKAFENATTTFIDGLINGTKSWHDLTQDAIKSIKGDLIKLFAGNVAEGIFGKGGLVDIGGMIAGPEGGGSISSMISGLFGKKDKPRGDAKTNPLYAEIVNQEVSPLDETSPSFLNPLEEGEDGGFLGGLKKSLTEAFGGLKTLFGDLLSGLKSGLTSIFDGLGGLFGDFGGQNIFGAVAGLFGFESGGQVPIKYEAGGMLVGPSHLGGGIPIEAEGGEYIVRKTQTAKWLPLLAAINEGLLDNISPMIRRPRSMRFADGGMVGAQPQKVAGKATPDSLKVMLSDSALNVTMRDWLERELASILATR